MKKQVNNQLDGIYNAVNEIAKEWQVSHASIVIIEQVVERSMIAPSILKDSKVKEFADLWNIMLEKLIKTCRDIANDMGTNKIPLKVFKSYIESLKEGFAEGLDKKQN